MRGGSRRRWAGQPPRWRRRLGAGLLSAAGASTLIATAAGIAIEGRSSSAVRVSSIQPVRAILHLLHLADTPVPDSLLSITNRPYATDSFAAMRRCVALVAGVNLGIVVVSAAVLLLIASALARRALWRREADDSVVATLAVSAAAVTPFAVAIEPLIRHAMPGRPMATILFSLATSCLALVAVAVALRLKHRAGGLASAATVGAPALLVVVTGLALLPSPKPSHADASTAINVVLVSIDSLRADHVGCYGYPRGTTPNIDRLAGEGTRFATVASSTSWTLPAHMSLLTALTCQRHKVVSDGDRLDSHTPVLAGVLAEAGYATAGIVAVPYMRAEYGFIRGFDEFDDYTVGGVSGYWRPWHRQHGERSPTTSSRLVELASSWIDRWAERGRERPFFLFLHLWDVHYDYEPPPEFDVFDPDYVGDLDASDFELNDTINPSMDPRDLERLIALYDGEILTTDHYLGVLFDRLRALGIFDRTLIVVTADHGDEFFEHGRKGHRKNLYDTTLLVPLVMRLPGLVPAGAVVPQQVRLIDVAPTILRLAGVTPPAGFGDPEVLPGLAARDLLPYARAVSGSPPPLPAIAHLTGSRATSVALRTDLSKLVHHRADASENVQLYDLLADPAELHDIATERSTAVAALLRALAAYEASVAPGAAPTFTMDEAQRQILRSLGYIQ